MENRQPGGKKGLSAAALVVETIILLFLAVYAGLQIFYGIYYRIPPFTYIRNILAAAAVWGILTLLAVYPETINHLPKEICIGKIRRTSQWMVRLVKLVFIGSLLIPCIADALGNELRKGYSAIVILLILAITAYCEIRIWTEIRRNNGK